jgi:HEAT repeat protein/4-amino-4-deoxy-L-arabinose transferase-like glycosyltransferase
MAVLPIKRGVRAAGGVILLLALAYFLPLVHYGLNIDDEGTLLYQIYRTYLGQLLYVDFHVGYTPGLFYWNAALFSLFGVNVVVLRLSLAVINALTVYCLYWLARRLGAGVLSAAAAGFLYLAFIPFYDGQFAAFNIPYPIWYTTLFWLLGVICVVHWWETGRRAWWLPAGLCAGVVFAFKPNSGLLDLAALLIALAVLERPADSGRNHGNRFVRFLARREYTLRWLIPVALTVALTLLFGRGAGLREVYLFGLPLIVAVAYQLIFQAGRNLARTAPPFTLWRNLLLLGLGFAVVTLPWTVYFWAHLGARGFLRAILFIGTGFDRFYYIPYPVIGTWGLGFAGAMAAALAVGLLLRWRLVSPVLVSAGIIAATVTAALWLLRHPPPMVEGFQSSVVMRVRDMAFVLILVTEWVALAAYIVQTARGRVFAVAMTLPVRASETVSSSQPARLQLGVLMILLLSGVLMHMQLYPRTDFMHLVTAAPGVLVLGAWLLSLLAEVWARGMARSPSGRAAVTAVVVAPVYVLIVTLIMPAVGRIEYLARAWWRNDHTATVVLDNNRAPLVLEPSAARPLLNLASTAHYLREHTRRDEFVFTFPILDILCFLSDRQNPTRHGYFFPGWPGHDVEAEVVDSLRARPPRYIVALHDHTLFFATAPIYYFNLREYVTTYYTLERRIGTFDILRPAAGSSPAPAPVVEQENDLRNAVPLWRAELSYRHGAPARRVAAMLADLGDAGVDTFAHQIGRLDPAAQRVVALLVRKSRSAAGAAALAVVLDDYKLPDPLYQLMTRVIIEVGDARAVAPIVDALKDATPAVRADLSGVVFNIASKTALEDYWYAPSKPRQSAAIGQVVRTDDLIQWIDNPWEWLALRSFAIHTAGWRNDPRVIPFLVRLLGDPGEYTELRVQAASSLVQLGYGPQVLRGIIRLLPKDPTATAALIVAVYPQNPEAGRKLMAKQMAAKDDATRRTAFWVAAGLHDGELADDLQEGLADPLPEVRMAAAWALGNLGASDSMAALQRVENDGDDQVALFARRAIQRIVRSEKSEVKSEK